jgi:hypothetical protein
VTQATTICWHGSALGLVAQVHASVDLLQGYLAVDVRPKPEISEKVLPRSAKLHCRLGPDPIHGFNGTPEHDTIGKAQPWARAQASRQIRQVQQDQRVHAHFRKSPRMNNFVHGCPLSHAHFFTAYSSWINASKIGCRPERHVWLLSQVPAGRAEPALHAGPV